MIKLTKGPKPSVLQKNALAWTAEYMSYKKLSQKAPSDVARRYNHKEIKQALISETNGKCAYCESKILHVCPADIEHILPKSLFPNLYVEWTNLTLSCEICNRSYKSDFYSIPYPLINPYKDNPEEFFIFIGEIIKPLNKRASITENILGLNRPNLYERRLDKLELIRPLLTLWVNEIIPERKKMWALQLKKQCAADSEFSACIKHYLISEGFPSEFL